MCLALQNIDISNSSWKKMRADFAASLKGSYFYFCQLCPTSEVKTIMSLTSFLLRSVGN